MKQKILSSKLNNQKGVTAADALVATAIILSTLGVIMMVYTNLVISSKEVNRKTAATRIITNVLENMDTYFYDEIQPQLDSLSNLGIATKNDSTYIISGTNTSEKVFNTKIPKGYILKISLENKNDLDLLKKVIVKVEFKVDGQTENVQLEKVFEREQVRECNSPNFEEEYIYPIVGEGTEYIVYSENAFSVQTGIKIICPISYDTTSKKYKLITESKASSIWYSYSNKQWARVLVLESNELNEYFDKTNKTLNDNSILTGDNSYVWIPRFGVRNGGSLSGDTLFKYKNTNVAILNSYDDSSAEMIYNYLDTENTVAWSDQRGISFDDNSNKDLGNWSKYEDLSKSNTDAYLLNNSQFGPMIEY